MKKAGEFLNPRQQEMLDKTAQGEEAYRQNKKAEEQALKEDCARAKQHLNDYKEIVREMKKSDVL